MLLLNSNKLHMDNIYKKGDVVMGKVDRFSPMGVNVILDDSTEGLLHKNEIFRQLRRGETIKVYIKEIREDGNITLSLQELGYRNFINDATEKVIQALEENEGSLNLNDKSSPEEIADRLQMSKKRFKDAIGALYKARKIEFTEKGIKLTNS
jgi:predicted RNA-binding protein (virulence factor B family)